MADQRRDPRPARGSGSSSGGGRPQQRSTSSSGGSRGSAPRSGDKRDGDKRACGMILDTETNMLEWHRVEYPIEQVQKLMKERKLPQRLISRLQFGL